MANEISLNINGTLTNGSLSDSLPNSNQQVTQSTAFADGLTATVTTSEGDITFATVTTMGWLWMRNTDATNYVQYGPKSAGSMVAFGKLKAGESCLLRLYPGITLRAKADTATCKLQLKLWND